MPIVSRIIFDKLNGPAVVLALLVGPVDMAAVEDPLAVVIIGCSSVNCCCTQEEFCDPHTDMFGWTVEGHC